jgi:hypothetical protein
VDFTLRLELGVFKLKINFKCFFAAAALPALNSFFSLAGEVSTSWSQERYHE